MSYDLTVFDPAAAPLEPEAFLSWYEDITEWSKDRDYWSPAGTTPALLAWYQDMAKEYPSMMDSDGVEDETRITDYSIDETLIYAAFAWSESQRAYETSFRLAAKHGIGFFDVSSRDGKVWVPEAPGELRVAFKTS